MCLRLRSFVVICSLPCSFVWNDFKLKLVEFSSSVSLFSTSSITSEYLNFKKINSKELGIGVTLDTKLPLSSKAHVRAHISFTLFHATKLELNLFTAIRASTHTCTLFATHISQLSKFLYDGGAIYIWFVTQLT